MAAGQGTRMRSSLPKVTHPLAGKPIVRHVIDAAREAGVDDCIVIIGADAAAAAVRAAADATASPVPSGCACTAKRTTC